MIVEYRDNNDDVYEMDEDVTDWVVCEDTHDLVFIDEDGDELHRIVNGFWTEVGFYEKPNKCCCKC